MKYSELQSSNRATLLKQLEESRKTLGKLRFQLANRTLKNHSQIKLVRKDVARVLTKLRSQNT